MKQLLLPMLLGKKKKYIPLIIGVAICTFFIISVDTMYRGYCDSQIESAYGYSGDWDIRIRINGEDYGRFFKEREGLVPVGFHSSTYNLRLGAVPEDMLYGDWKDLVTDYYLALYGITGEENYVLPYHLTQGRWPESDTELVIPSTMVLGEHSVADKTIQIGDKLVLECGRRRTQGGVYTQEQITEPEEFLLDGTKEYTVCGFIEYEDYRTDKFVLYGFTGLSNTGQYGGEELILYYKLTEPSVANLDTLQRSLEGELGVMEAESNFFIRLALSMVENSDYLRSVRLGLYLFEGLLLVVGLCIAGANQYQSILEEKRQIGLFDSIGASRKQLSALYCLTNVIAIGIAFLFAFVLYGILILFVRTSLGANLRNSYFQADSYAPDFRVCILVMGLMTAGLLWITHHLLQMQIPRRKDIGKEKRLRGQTEIHGIVELSGSNNRAMRAKSRVRVLVSVIVLLLVPVFLAIFQSAYRVGSQLTRSGSADFYMLVGGYGDAKVEEEMDSNPYVKHYRRKVGGNRHVLIPAEFIREDVVERIKKVYNFPANKTGLQIFTENNEYDESIGMIFVDEDYYNELNELNDGSMPPYEEFISGDHGIIYAVFTFSDTKEQVDVGKSVAEHMKRMDLEPFTEGEIPFSLDILGSIREAHINGNEDYLSFYIYIPEHIYKTYGENMPLATSYGIDGYKNSLPQLAKSLQDIAQRYNAHFQDNVTESSTAKDALWIQYVTCLSCAAIVVLMSVCVISIMGKIDFVSRQQTYHTYCILGLGFWKAFVIQLLEHFFSFSSAVLISIIMHYFMFFTFLRGVYGYYGISLRHIGILYLFVVLGMAVILLVNALHVTRQRFGKSRLPD
ncbi:MAG: hypothetical protein K2N63_11235 [Lachnospiraceae bacterium]|nr:hypothetical protein [Lachnospiraceae bacterium]